MARKTNATEESKEAKKESKARIDFPKADAKMVGEDGKVVKATNKEGQLLTVPKPLVDGDKVVYEGYSLTKHKPLKKTDFADMATYLDYQAFVARAKSAKLIASAEDKEAKAERLRKYGDEASRKKVEKLLKLREKLAAYEKLIEDEGLEVPDEDE